MKCCGSLEKYLWGITEIDTIPYDKLPFVFLFLKSQQVLRLVETLLTAEMSFGMDRAKVEYTWLTRMGTSPVWTCTVIWIQTVVVGSWVIEYTLINHIWVINSNKIMTFWMGSWRHLFELICRRKITSFSAPNILQHRLCIQHEMWHRTSHFCYTIIITCRRFCSWRF